MYHEESANDSLKKNACTKLTLMKEHVGGRQVVILFYSKVEEYSLYATQIRPTLYAGHSLCPELV